MHKITFLLAFGLAAASALPRQGRIVGGTVTNINTYPFSAVILFANNIIFRQHCGGIIVNNRSVVTAAHCTHGRANMNSFRIRVGSTTASSGGTTHNIAQRINHPQYEQGIMNNDIGVLRVTNAFQFGNTVRAGSLIGQNVNVPDNALVWAIGWGWTSHGGFNPSEQLRHVQLRTVNTARCQSVYTAFRITAAMMCAGWDAGGRGSCQGDSGSPLIHNNVIVGVTSFGMQCGSARYPTVYARVAQFTNWIRNVA